MNLRRGLQMEIESGLECGRFAAIRNLDFTAGSARQRKIAQHRGSARHQAERVSNIDALHLQVCLELRKRSFKGDVGRTPGAAPEQGGVNARKGSAPSIETVVGREVGRNELGVRSANDKTTDVDAPASAQRSRI